MTLQAVNPLESFQWTPQPEAEKLVRELIESFVSKNSFASQLSRRMKEETGTRFNDWVEGIFAPASVPISQKLTAVGYEQQASRVWSNPNGMFPKIVLHDSSTMQLHLKVGSVVDFADVWRLRERILGIPGGVYRRVRASKEADTELWAAERWGYGGFEILRDDPSRTIEMMSARESFLTRGREFDS